MPHAEPALVKMADLAKRSGVPAATIKHYLREGLLPEPSVRTSRNMAYYDAALVPRIQAIKELQRTRFLPLKVIREVLGGTDPYRTEETFSALTSALARLAPSEQRTRAELEAAGMPGSELDFFVRVGLVTPEGEGPEARFSGDDLAILRTLAAARKAGIRADMLPHTIVGPYVLAMRELVRVELSMFREGVLPLAGDDLTGLVAAATTLSEELVVLLRRKMIVPMLKELVREETASRNKQKSRAPVARTRRKP